MNYQTIITPKNLDLNKEKKDWLILDCRGVFVNNHDRYQSFEEAHIPNAYFCSHALLTGQEDSRPKTLHSASLQAKQSLYENGFSTDLQIILYDLFNTSGINSLWLQFRSMGFKNTAVLEGGLIAWQSAGYEMSSLCPVSLLDAHNMEDLPTANV